MVINLDRASLNREDNSPELLYQSSCGGKESLEVQNALGATAHLGWICCIRKFNFRC